MIVYQKDGSDYLLLDNSSRGVMKISTANLEKAEPILNRVADKRGLGYDTIAGWTGVDHLDKLDAGHALVFAGPRGIQLPWNRWHSRDAHSGLGLPPRWMDRRPGHGGGHTLLRPGPSGLGADYLPLVSTTGRVRTACSRDCRGRGGRVAAPVG